MLLGTSNFFFFLIYSFNIIGTGNVQTLGEHFSSGVSRGAFPPLPLKIRHCINQFKLIESFETINNCRNVILYFIGYFCYVYINIIL